MADTYATQSPFIDKAADQADLDRQNALNVATIGAVGKAMTSAGAGTPTSPIGDASQGLASAPTPAQMGVSAPVAAPSAAAPAPAAAASTSPFDAFTKLLNDNDPSLAALRARAVTGANSQFDNPAAAFDQGAAISREDLGRSIQSARNSQREDLIKTFGANASQVLPQLGAFDQNAILQGRDLNRRLTADRATAANAGLGQAIASSMGILGQQSQEQLGKAGLALGAGQSAQQQSQFDTSVKTQISEADKARNFQADQAATDRTFQSAEAALGRKFTTEERSAVQDFQAAQQKGAQDFTSAENMLGRKFTTEERQAIQQFQTSERKDTQTYQSAETALGRKFSTEERTAVQDFQNAQRLGAQDFASAEAMLGRKFTTEERQAIQTYQTSERLSTQDFQSMLTEKGYVHDNDLEIMRDNLQRELQDKGISADQAKQQADQKFQELTQQRDQTFTSTQADITRKWTSGERIDTQDYQKAIQGNEFKQQDTLAQLQALTQKAIAQGGWDNATKLQAQQLLAAGAEADKTRSQQYLMFTATQAQQDSQFAKEFGLKQEEVQANTANTKAQLEIAAKQLGITSEQWAMQKDDAQFNKDLELAQYGISMWNGEDSAALEPFVTKLAATMGKGLGLDPATLTKAIESKFSKGATTTADTAGTAGAMEKAQGQVDTISSSLPANVDTDAVKNILGDAAKGAWDKNEIDILFKSDVPGWREHIYGGQADWNPKTGRAMEPTPDQIGKDYYSFYRLTQAGVPDKKAADLLTTAIGADRFKAAYKGMTGKDWA